MKKAARARFAIKSWNEKPYSEGRSSVGHGMEHPFELSYELPSERV